MSDHHPPHIYMDDTWYMITSSTYQRQHFFAPQGHKEILRDFLKSFSVEFNLHLAAWVILDNHYHILVKCCDGNLLARFFRQFHGRTSYELNRSDGSRGRQVWHNYWDTFIRTETDYWTKFNYIHHNPVKHHYVQITQEWPFSSYQYYLDKKGLEWLMDAFFRYPVVDFTGEDEHF